MVSQAFILRVAISPGAAAASVPVTAALGISLYNVNVRRTVRRRRGRQSTIDGPCPRFRLETLARENVAPYLSLLCGSGCGPDFVNTVKSSRIDVVPRSRDELVLYAVGVHQTAYL